MSECIIREQTVHINGKVTLRFGKNPVVGGCAVTVRFKGGANGEGAGAWVVRFNARGEVTRVIPLTEQPAPRKEGGPAGHAANG